MQEVPCAAVYGALLLLLLHNTDDMGDMRDMGDMTH